MREVSSDDRSVIQPPPEPLLTPAEAAAILKVSVRTLDRYQADGYIQPHRTPTGRRRFRRSDVEALLRGAA